MGSLKNVIKSFAFGWFRMNKNFIEFPRQVKVICTEGHSKSTIPKIIWMYWEDQELPKSIKSFINNIQIINPDHEVKILNQKSVLEYLPNLNINTEMKIAQKADLIRLELLYSYGGIWIDASIIFQEDLSWIHLVNQEKSYDLIGYYREINTYDLTLPVIEVWFLASPTGNKFIGKWLEIFKPLGELGSNKYFELLKSRSDYNEISQGINPPDYFLIYLACQIAQRESPDMQYYLKKAEDQAFFIHEHFQWNRAKISYYLTQIKYSNQDYGLIKITSADRKYIDQLEKYKVIKKNSLIGKLYKRSLN